MESHKFQMHRSIDLYTRKNGKIVPESKMSLVEGEEMACWPYNREFFHAHGFTNYAAERNDRMGLFYCPRLDKYFPAKYTVIFQIPKDEQIGEMVMDGDIESVVGDRCYEPDGHDENKFPSWLLALGIV